MLGITLTASTVLLAAIMLAAAVAKVATRREFEGSLRLLVPGRVRLVAVSSRLVPLLEAAAAVVIVAVPRAGAAMILLLLAAFSVVAELVVLQGRDIPCACFGRLSQSRLGHGTVARNAALGALCGSILVFSGDVGPLTLPTVLLGLLLAGALAMLEWALRELARAREYIRAEAEVSLQERVA
jgi:hypothetical protein